MCQASLASGLGCSACSARIQWQAATNAGAAMQHAAAGPLQAGAQGAAMRPRLTHRLPSRGDPITLMAGVLPSISPSRPLRATDTSPALFPSLHILAGGDGTRAGRNNGKPWATAACPRWEEPASLSGEDAALEAWGRPAAVARLATTAEAVTCMTDLTMSMAAYAMAGNVAEAICTRLATSRELMIL